MHQNQINKAISRTNSLTSWYNKTNNMNRSLIMPLSNVMNLSVAGECHASWAFYEKHLTRRSRWL